MTNIFTGVQRVWLLAAKHGMIFAILHDTCETQTLNGIGEILSLMLGDCTTQICRVAGYDIQEKYTNY